MKRLAAMLGQHLFLRLYLYQVLIIVALVGTYLTLKQTVFEPQEHLKQGGMLYLGEWALRGSDQPPRLQRELDALQERIGLSLAVYSREGRLLIQGGLRPAPRLDEETLVRLERSGRGAGAPLSRWRSSWWFLRLVRYPSPGPFPSRLAN